MECSPAAGGTKGPVWQRPLFQRGGGGGAAYVARDDGGHFSGCPQRGWTSAMQPWTCMPGMDVGG